MSTNHQTNIELLRIETLEKKYLYKYFHFLKFVEDELLFGFQTKFKIKNDWFSKWDPSGEGKGISDFSTGAERIVYALFNGKCIGQPNSAPIGSDLFFEVDDAFIHIDLKTVQTRNIGDYSSNIFVGNNQNSYNGTLIVNGKQKIYKEACLPHYYTLENGDKKPCLTYFITILYREEDLEILNINLMCMPNGILFPIYGEKILSAGKILHKEEPKRSTHAKSIRYNWSENQIFELLKKDNENKRILVVYFNENNKNITSEQKEKLSKIEKINSDQSKFL